MTAWSRFAAVQVGRSWCKVRGQSAQYQPADQGADRPDHHRVGGEAPPATGIGGGRAGLGRHPACGVGPPGPRGWRTRPSRSRARAASNDSSKRYRSRESCQQPSTPRPFRASTAPKPRPELQPIRRRNTLEKCGTHTTFGGSPGPAPRGPSTFLGVTHWSLLGGVDKCRAG